MHKRGKRSREVMTIGGKRDRGVSWLSALLYELPTTQHRGIQLSRIGQLRRGVQTSRSCQAVQHFEVQRDASNLLSRKGNRHSREGGPIGVQKKAHLAGPITLA